MFSLILSPLNFWYRLTLLVLMRPPLISLSRLLVVIEGCYRLLLRAFCRAFCLLCSISCLLSASALVISSSRAANFCFFILGEMSGSSTMFWTDSMREALVTAPDPFCSKCFIVSFTILVNRDAYTVKYQSATKPSCFGGEFPVCVCANRGLFNISILGTNTALGVSDTFLT